MRNNRNQNVRGTMHTVILSPRQTQVADLLLQGFGPYDVSREIGVSVRAVRASMQLMCIKFGISQEYRTTKQQPARLLAVALAKRGVNP